MPNLPFKSVVLPLFDPKMGPKKRVPNYKEDSFWPFKPLYGCYFILKLFYSYSAQRKCSLATKFMSIGLLLTIL